MVVSNSAPTNGKLSVQSFVLGISLYITIIYLPFATAVTMALSTSQYRLTVATCCILVAGVTIISGFATKTPLVIVPALGTTFLIVPFLTQLSWLTLSFSCVAAGVVSGFLGLSGLRRRLLDNLPPEILMGIRAAIGTLIGSSAIATLQTFVAQNSTHIHDSLYVIFVVAVIALSIWDRLPNALSSFARLPNGDLFRALMQIHYIVVPLILSVYCYEAGFSTVIGHLSAGASNLPNLTEGTQILLAVPLTFSLVFILITDIPGHPYEFLGRGPSMQQHLGRSVILRDKQIKRGFMVDALGALVSAVLLAFHIPIAPSIYVAENAVAHEFKWSSYGGAVVAALCFLITGLILFAFPAAASRSGGYLTLGVTPVLFFIAVKMVARSMFVDTDIVTDLVPEYVDAADGDELTVVAQKRAHSTAAEALDFYIPGALMILLTFTNVGLSLSLPVGIVASFVLRYSRGSKLAEGNGMLFIFALTSIVFWVAVHLSAGA